jgi:hypothetical protein
MASSQRVLLVGGTGILAPALRALIADGTPTVVVGRDGERVEAAAGGSLGPLVQPCIVDVTDARAWAAAVEGVAAAGGVTDAVAYMPFAGADAWTALAGVVGRTLVPVLPSGAADPGGASIPVPAAARSAASVHVLLLGWHGRGRGRTRWHTPEEVSAAALRALAGSGQRVAAAELGVTGVDAVYTLGSLRPWSDRPGH